MIFRKLSILTFTQTFIFFLVLAGPVFAGEDLGNGWHPKPLEISRLPKYCHKQLLNDDSGSIYKVFTGCDGIHHLCPGLILIQRAGTFSIPKGERKRILRQAKNEIGYVSVRLKSSCTASKEVQAAESQIRFLDTVLK